jgi:glycerol-3-phosphate dehydrogenase
MQFTHIPGKSFPKRTITGINKTNTRLIPTNRLASYIFRNVFMNSALIIVSLYQKTSDMSSLLQKFSDHRWDIIVIGGGATGAGVAVDAAARNFSTLLLEQADFGKGTSSRSTKLLHGGVRYMAQGDLLLVTEALRERGIIIRNAPHITGNQEFVIPVYNWWDKIKYTIGLKFYDILAGRRSLGKSRFISVQSTIGRLPALRPSSLKGGVVYHDGQFDDSRLLISLVRTLHDHGGKALNYCRATALVKDATGKITGVKACCSDSKEYVLNASLVINATGVFSDDIIRMDHTVRKRTIKPSQGIHLVFDRSFLGGDSALMIPKTDDGRVLFAIPWYDKVVVGTTDTPLDDISLEPKALEEEINFILHTAADYLNKPPGRKDVLSMFAGLRPLAANPDNPENTREISRRHKISIFQSGLVTVEGGKWTTYRRMAEETLNKAMRQGLLEKRPCMTATLKLHGYADHYPQDRLHIYGTDASEIRKMMNERPGWSLKLHPSLPYTEAEIRWICRNEMVCRLEDVLARRTRALFLDASASLDMALPVATIMADELKRDQEWIIKELNDYKALVRNYMLH